MSLTSRKYTTLYQDNKTGAESFATNITGDTEYAVGMAAKYTSTLPTLSNGDWSFARCDAKGRQIVVVEESTSTGVLVQVATGAAAIATTTAIAAEFRLLKIVLHLDAAPTTSENLTITLDSNAGAAYDTVFNSIDLSSASTTDYIYKPIEGEGKFVSGDEIVVAYTNTDTGTYGLSIYYELV